MDWRAYHAINRFVVHHSWLGRLFHGIESYGTIAIGVAAFALWLLARPGGERKWKLVAGAALDSAPLALVVNKLISSSWHRDRPFQSHHAAPRWRPRTTAASVTSGHARA